MKKLLLLLLAIPFLAATNYAPDFSGITTAMTKGDATQLSKFFDAKVDLSVLGNETKLDKIGATGEVKRFFGTNAVASFQLMHQGISKDQVSHYGIGDLTAGGKAYRVFVYLRDTGGQFLIQELRIEKK
jgi:hypothetical protein